MKLSEALFRIKTQIPNIKESGITDTELGTLLRQGCDKVNLLAKVYKTYTDFNIVADQSIYSLSVIAPTYLGIDKKVVYFKDSSSQWQDVIPKTKKWIEKSYPNYLNAASQNIPTWYWVEEDELGFYAPPSTSTSNGGRIYHLKKAGILANNDHYFWSGNSTEISALNALDDAVIAYVRWKLSPSIGAVSDADLRYNEFLNEVKLGASQIKRRPDLSIDDSYGINI
jgi:hypothetical protein